MPLSKEEMPGKKRLCLFREPGLSDRPVKELGQGDACNHVRQIMLLDGLRTDTDDDGKD